MDNDAGRELEQALRTLDATMGKSERAGEKFAPGTAQHALLKNRIKALQIAVSLISEELGRGGAAGPYTREELEQALAPLASLASKSEKAREKLAPGTWQHTMLDDILRALRLASPLLAKALKGAGSPSGA